jgi:hypothetical protein
MRTVFPYCGFTSLAMLCSDVDVCPLASLMHYYMSAYLQTDVQIKSGNAGGVNEDSAAAEDGEDEEDLSLELEEGNEGSDTQGEEECLEDDIEGEGDTAAAEGSKGQSDEEPEKEEGEEDAMDALNGSEEELSEEEEGSEGPTGK